MKKILIIHPKLNLRGGAERKILLLREYLIAKKYEVSIYCFIYDKKSTFDELLSEEHGIKEVGSWGTLFEKIKTIYKYHRIINKEQPNIVISSNYPANILSLLTYGKKNRNYIWICNEIALELIRRNGLTWMIYYKLERYLNKKFKTTIVNSEATRNKFIRYYGVEPLVVRSGLDTKYLQKIIPETFPELNNQAFFLILGRVEFHKNIEFIPEICDVIIGVKKGVKIVVAGSGDGVDYIIELTKKYENLIYLGSVTESQKRWLYENCKAFLFLPHDEPLGVTLLEAIYYGAEVVAYNKGGPSEIVVGEEIGSLVNTSAEYLVCVHNILFDKSFKKNNTQLLRRKHIEKNYSVEKMLENFEYIINGIGVKK